MPARISRWKPTAPVAFAADARFFFNLFNDVVAIDNQGVELPDFEAARKQALTGAAEIIAERITQGERVQLDHRIEVQNAEREVIWVLRFRDLVDFGSEGR